MFFDNLPVRSLLSIRFRSASIQNSFPNLLSKARATGLISPVVNRDSLSVPSRLDLSILAERSCTVVKYMYLQTGTRSCTTTPAHSYNTFSCPPLFTNTRPWATTAAAVSRETPPSVTKSNRTVLREAKPGGLPVLTNYLQCLLSFLKYLCPSLSFKIFHLWLLVFQQSKHFEIFSIFCHFC